IQSIWASNESLAGMIYIGDTPVFSSKVVQLLTDQLRVHESVIEIAWASPRGIVKTSTISDRRGVSLLPSEALDEITKGRDRIITPLPGDFYDTLTIGIASAIRSGDKLLGIIVSIVPDESLKSIIPVALADGRYVGI